MAATKESTGGFSYAQAARGRAQSTPPQAQSNKATPGAVTPASEKPALGKMPELIPGSSWADDVEASVAEKHGSSQGPEEESKSTQKTEESLPQQQSDEPMRNGTSGVSSPDLSAAISSTTTPKDDESSVPTASSESTWESKSSASEPSWIAEREKRQISMNTAEESVAPDEKLEKMEKVERATKQSPARPHLHDAPPPAVNPWAARLQASGTKVAASPSPPKSSNTAGAAESRAANENQRPKTDTRRKANSVAGLPRDADFNISISKDTKKSQGIQGKKNEEVRVSNPRQASQGGGETTADAGRRPTARTSLSERQSLPNVTMAPPPVRDQTTWPTPDTTQEKERKRSQEKDAFEKSEEMSTPTAKPHGKTEWKVLPVVPSIVFASQDQIRGPRPDGTGSRGRGGSSMRGRGGYRGQNSAGERSSGSVNNALNSEESASTTKRGRSDAALNDREAMPPPSKPDRASSAGSLREQRKAEHRGERTPRFASVEDSAPVMKPSADTRSAESEKDLAPQAAAPVLHYSHIRPNRSPKRQSVVLNGVQDEERIPDPIPRRNSVGTQTEEPSEITDTNSREGPPIRMVPSENRKEARPFDNYRDPNWNGVYRGKGRGGRGRGASREVADGHNPNSHSFSHGHPNEYANATTYPVPPSPTGYALQRGGHQTPYSQQGRNAWRGAGSRSQSIPIEGYGRFAGQHGVPPQPLQTYFTGMYNDEYANMPMTAAPWQPFMDPFHLFDTVSTQVEYYFSMDNMLKDMFLRKNMDSQGYIFLNVIANFNRIKQLTTDLDLIRSVCLASENIEIRVGEDGKDRLRKRQGWEQFVLPIAERHPEAQNDGPAHVDPPKLQTPVFGQPQMRTHGPNSAAVHTAQMRRSQHAAYPITNGAPVPAFFNPMTEAPSGEMVNGDEMRGRQAKSPIRENSVSLTDKDLTVSIDELGDEPDKFIDGQIEALMVVVRSSSSNLPRAPFHSAASRTFSNGSIDSRSIMDEMQKFDDRSSRRVANGEKPLKNGGDNPGKSRHQSPDASRMTNGTPSNTTPISVLWVKNKEVPVNTLPLDLGHEPYTHLRFRALDQHKQASTGNCPYDMDVLYQFWSHFLIRNFNRGMYAEFRDFATHDATVRQSMTGMENLIKYYGEALSSQNSIRDRVAQDYIELVKSERAQPKGEGAAFKQLRNAWRNGALNLKNRKKMSDIIDAALKAELDQS